MVVNHSCCLHLNVKKSLFRPTFHFHDLIRVLDHFIFGLVAERMRPGLNQIQDLIPDIWFRLFLKAKEKMRKRNSRHKDTTSSGNRKMSRGQVFVT